MPLRRIYRLVFIDNVKMDIENVSLVNFPYWLVDDRGELVVGCPSLDVATAMKDKLNNDTDGDVDITLMMADTIRELVKKRGHFAKQTELVVADPSDLDVLNEDEWLKEQKRKSELSKTRKHNWRKK